MPIAISKESMSTVQLVPLTPMSPDGRRVEYERLTMFARDLYDAGIRVFLPAAGTGEWSGKGRERKGGRVSITSGTVAGDRHNLAI